MTALIVSARLDEDNQRRFDELRRAHFPPERNFISAHLTLFHALPSALLNEIEGALQSATHSPPLPARVSSVMKLGFGVAFRIECGPLIKLRSNVAARFGDVLTPQDANKADLHITVQNKVSPEQALALHDSLAENFEPYDASIVALELWHYRDGPWEAISQFPFANGD